MVVPMPVRLLLISEVTVIAPKVKNRAAIGPETHSPTRGIFRRKQKHSFEKISTPPYSSQHCLLQPSYGSNLDAQ